MYQRGNQFDAKLNDEFGRIEQAINFPQEALRLESRGAAVIKPRAGTVVYADGSAWNPGSGAGPYYYNGSAWKPLGGESGGYTPTLTNVLNVAASTGYVCQWMRVGNVITVSGKVDIDPTAAGVTRLGLSLPYASAMSAEEQCSGTAAAPCVAGQCAAIKGDATNDRAQIEWTAVDVTSQSWFFTFTYQVI